MNLTFVFGWGHRGPHPVSYTHLDVYKRQVMEKFSGENNSSQPVNRAKILHSHYLQKIKFSIPVWFVPAVPRWIVNPDSPGQFNSLKVPGRSAPIFKSAPAKQPGRFSHFPPLSHSLPCLLYTSRCV